MAARGFGCAGVLPARQLSVRGYGSGPSVFARQLARQFSRTDLGTAEVKHLAVGHIAEKKRKLRKLFLRHWFFSLRSLTCSGNLIIIFQNINQGIINMETK